MLLVFHCISKPLRAILPMTSSPAISISIQLYTELEQCLRQKSLRAILPMTSSSPYIYLYTNKKSNIPYGIPLFLYGADDRTHIASQSALLGYPNASHFGTNLRTFLLKTIINRFIYAKTFLSFKSSHLQLKRESTLWVLSLFGRDDRI